MKAIINITALAMAFASVTAQEVRGGSIVRVPHLNPHWPTSPSPLSHTKK